MTFTVALVIVLLCVVLAYIVAPAAILLCLLAAFLLVTAVLPAFPWLPMAAAFWLLLQLIAGLKAAISAAPKPAAPPKQG